MVEEECIRMFVSVVSLAWWRWGSSMYTKKALDTEWWGHTAILYIKRY